MILLIDVIYQTKKDKSSIDTNPIHCQDNRIINILFDKHLDLAGITMFVA